MKPEPFVKNAWLVLSLLALKKVCRSTIQSDNFFESYRYTIVKPVFSDSGGQKTSRFRENWESHFLHIITTLMRMYGKKYKKFLPPTV